MNEFQPSVALIVPCRNQDWDWRALRRLLTSLEQSDFPKSYFLYVPVLTAIAGWNTRENGVQEALKSKCEYFLVADNDTYVPKSWWQKSLEILEADEQIGALCYLNAKDDFEHFEGSYRELKVTE